MKAVDCCDSMIRQVDDAQQHLMRATDQLVEDDDLQDSAYVLVEALAKLEAARDGLIALQRLSVARGPKPSGRRPRP